jgi:predicted sugar kinase
MALEERGKWDDERAAAVMESFVERTYIESRSATNEAVDSSTPPTHYGSTNNRAKDTRFLP